MSLRLWASHPPDWISWCHLGQFQRLYDFGRKWWRCICFHKGCRIWWGSPGGCRIGWFRIFGRLWFCGRRGRTTGRLRWTLAIWRLHFSVGWVRGRMPAANYPYWTQSPPDYSANTQTPRRSPSSAAYWPPPSTHYQTYNYKNSHRNPHTQ